MKTWFQWRFGFLICFAFAIACGHGPLLGQVVSIGKAKYRTDLPPDAQGNPRRLIKKQPSVSDQFTGPVPTNDWCSSLVWPLHSPHSLPMFAHPLAMQAHQSGLGLGYNPVASVKPICRLSI